MAFARTLLDWFEVHGRKLPWRGIDDPYRIWLSEIILQQTRIEQGRAYYHRFVEAFPTVQGLAAATEEEVLRLWQGLGYYSRARNLHRAAREVVEQWGGEFPKCSADLMKLSGVGRYTAAAIASFAFREEVPVIDGNVYRFIARWRGISTPVPSDAAYREFERLLRPLMRGERADLFNAALMDFGSMQCTPYPQCEECPFASECRAKATDRVELLPVRTPKRKPTDRWFYYFDLRWMERQEEYTLLHQRGADDIWAHLFEMPLLETERQLVLPHESSCLRHYIKQTFGLKAAPLQVTDEVHHQLSHRTIHARFVRVDLAERPPQIPDWCLVISRSEAENKPVPRLIDRYLRKL